MQSNDTPKLETLDDGIGLRLDKETKRRLNELKTKHNVDVPEWLRKIIKRELDALKVC